MYLTHYGFEQFPFHLTPDTTLFLGLAPHYEAIQMVSAAIAMGEGMIKVTGEVGTGKTMVCRMLLTHLNEDIQWIYLPNPALSGMELRRAVATELNLSSVAETQLIEAIQSRLMAWHFQGKRVVAMVDEAQALSDDALETLRLFGNLETEQSKLLQMVLLGQPELDERLAQHHLRQFRQRITFSAQLRPLSVSETVAYIDNRLCKSGVEKALFSHQQKKAVWRASKGIPRLLNQVCHKALLLAFYAQQHEVSNVHLYHAIHDTFDTCKPKFKQPLLWGWSNQ
ncbi:ExeA family protein [Vibrio cincinnatiensis]|jgi:MSHA biogenesis protein MshM|uniref:ExeA family protein n=1 Tax=Vibrio cincinnatiensis TaxID=675 RepID=UPI001EDFCDD9|nr:AAA family ATPase [Vibrio cincinnatiensis]MCG3721788.1 MSHA biogenesis protein MshM [Vibrio cincinnatiensis]